MGNTIERLANPDYVDERTRVDGGRVYIPIDRNSQRAAAVHMASNGVTVVTRPAGPEYDPAVVARLIMARRLAPVYDGMSEEDARRATAMEPDHGESLVTSSSDEGSGSLDGKNPKSGKKKLSFLRKLKLRKRRIKEKSRLAIMPEEWLRTGMIECPICYLCCNKPICTGCFINLRRPPSGRFISCPFCNATNFTVIYICPKKIIQLEEAEEEHRRQQLAAEAAISLEDNDESNVRADENHADDAEFVENQMKKHANSHARRRTISAEAIRPYQPPLVLHTPIPRVPASTGQPVASPYFYRSTPYNNAYVAPRYPQPPAQYAAPRPYVTGGRYILYQPAQQPASQPRQYHQYGARYYGGSGRTNELVDREDQMLREAIRQSLLEEGSRT